jgi:hypothetical protein
MELPMTRKAGCIKVQNLQCNLWSKWVQPFPRVRMRLAPHLSMIQESAGGGWRLDALLLAARHAPDMYADQNIFGCLRGLPETYG